MGKRRLLLLVGALAAALGLAWPWLTTRHAAPLAPAKVFHEEGHAYIALLPTLDGVERIGDNLEQPRHSPLLVLENGSALGPAHTLHGAIRSVGQGRYSHWGNSLYFSASDNTDPRRNGRAYAVAYTGPIAPAAGWLLLLAGAGLLLSAGREPLGPLPVVQAAAGRIARLRSAVAIHWLPVSLFAILAALAAGLGAERSAWILVTQPSEAMHALNSMLGHSWIDRGGVLHRENYSSFMQMAYFAGADVTPDPDFRRPVYAFFATVVAGIFGAGGALLAVNIIAWATGVWLTHRFTRRFFEDEMAARWAAPLAAAGIGFAVHALDLGGHLLAFTFYMGGVVLIFESEAWKRRVGFREHATIALYLALACLQSDTALALVAAYFLVAIRHNRWSHVVAACVVALAAQPLWGAILGELFRQRRDIPLADLSAAELGHLQRALGEWKRIFGEPMGRMAGDIGRIVLSFAAFEMPLVVGLGALGLLRFARASPETRSRFRFAVPFIALPMLSALVLATAAPARGHLVYGISIFFFAGSGAVLAALARRSEGRHSAIAALAVVASIAWSTAHYGNVLGPAKAYFLGFDAARNEFRLSGWEAQSLTDAEGAPRLFGGAVPLSKAGLVRIDSKAAFPPERRPSQAVAAAILFTVLVVGFLARYLSPGWPGIVAWVLLVVLLTRVGAEASGNRNAPFLPEESIPVEAGGSVTYEVMLGSYLQRRLATGLRQGAVLTVFPAFHSGDAPPRVEINGVAIRTTDRLDARNWALFSEDVLKAFHRPQGVMKVTIAGGAGGTSIGGWQAKGLPGRRLEGKGVDHPSAVLPAVELRLLRDLPSRALLLVAF